MHGPLVSREGKGLLTYSTSAVAVQYVLPAAQRGQANPLCPAGLLVPAAGAGLFWLSGAPSPVSASLALHIHVLGGMITVIRDLSRAEADSRRKGFGGYGLSRTRYRDRNGHQPDWCVCVCVCPALQPS